MPLELGTISLELVPVAVESPYSIYIYLYDASTYIELKYRCAREIPFNLEQLFKGKKIWIEIISTNVDLIRDVLMRFKVYSFVLEDMQVLDQCIKLSVFNDSIYLLLRLIYLNETSRLIEQQQLSFYLRDNILITVQEYRTRSLFSIIKHRLAKKPVQPKGRLKVMKTDYLFYSLINVVIENYMSVLESILYEIERIDKELMFSTKNKVNTLNIETLKLIFNIKHDLLHFKIVCAPLKDIIIKLQKTREGVIPKRQRPALRQCRRRLKRRMRRCGSHARPSLVPPITSAHGEEDDEYLPDDGVLVLNDYIYTYFKRLLDHVVQLNDTIDSYTDVITSLIDFYMILNGEIVNGIMQTLTITSCMILPLNFFSSLSSMNFDYMPQIPLHYGYFGQLALIGLLGIVMIIWSKLHRLF